MLSHILQINIQPDSLPIPMRRLVPPYEVGELVTFLNSDASSYLTSTQNVMDGGSTLPASASFGVSANIKKGEQYPIRGIAHLLTLFIKSPFS